jgi:hypothetical protein
MSLEQYGANQCWFQKNESSMNGVLYLLTSLATKSVLYGSPEALGSLCGSSAKVKKNNLS